MELDWDEAQVRYRPILSLDELSEGANQASPGA